MRVVECVQLTPEWWEARRGIPTASGFDQIMSPSKRKPSASQAPYIAKLIGDITDLRPNYFTAQGGPVNHSVAYGRETEDEARRWYEMQQKCSVRQIGFCTTDDGRFGCSPDGLVDPDGGLEIRCPDRSTHMLCLMSDEIPLAKKCQIHGCLIVTGRKWWDYVDYCTGLPALYKRVVPDDFTMALRVQLELFDVKFQAAKKKFNVNGQTDEPWTELTKTTVEEHAKGLIRLEDELKDKGFQHGIDTINGWIHDMQDKPGVPPVPYQTKRETWRVLWAFCERQGWSYDSVNKLVRKEASVTF